MLCSRASKILTKRDQEVPSERQHPTQSSLAFDLWKLKLRKDCERQGKLLAFDAIGDYALRLLWETGLDPTIRAILEYHSEQNEKPN